MINNDELIVLRAFGVVDIGVAFHNARQEEGAECDYRVLVDIPEDEQGRWGYVYHDVDSTDIKVELLCECEVRVVDLTLRQIITAWTETYALDGIEFNPVSLRNMLNEMIDAHSIHV